MAELLIRFLTGEDLSDNMPLLVFFVDSTIFLLSIIIPLILYKYKYSTNTKNSKKVVLCITMSFLLPLLCFLCFYAFRCPTFNEGTELNNNRKFVKRYTDLVRYFNREIQQEKSQNKNIISEKPNATECHEWLIKNIYLKSYDSLSNAREFTYPIAALLIGFLGYIIKNMLERIVDKFRNSSCLNWLDIMALSASIFSFFSIMMVLDSQFSLLFYSAVSTYHGIAILYEMIYTYICFSYWYLISAFLSATVSFGLLAIGAGFVNESQPK